MSVKSLYSTCISNYKNRQYDAEEEICIWNREICLRMNFIDSNMLVCYTSSCLH